MKTMKIEFTQKWIYDRFFRTPGTIMEVPVNDGLGLITRGVAREITEEDAVDGDNVGSIEGASGLHRYQD